MIARSVEGIVRRSIAALIILQFVVGYSPAGAYASAQNLRPTAVRKDGGRLTGIKNDLGAASLDRVAKPGTMGSVVSKDGGKFEDILGDYRVASTVRNLPFGTFLEQQIDLKKSPDAKKALERAFGAINAGDQFFTVLWENTVPLAIVKKSVSGAVEAKKVAEDIEALPLSVLSDNVEKLRADAITAADILIRDYLILEKRSHIDITKRMTVEFGELRDYVYELAKKVGEEKAKEIASAIAGQESLDIALAAAREEAKKFGREKAKETGLALAGGKGLSLSVMSRVVDVPSGFNVTTTAYFKFVKDNPEVWGKIFNELQTLDTMDDQKRDVVSAEIREVMKNAPLPEDIKAEVTAMYHQICVRRYLASGKAAPAPVAVRSSGTKEDIHVKTWIEGISTGSQAGQSDTFLNVKGDRDVLDKLRADFASLFTDRAVSYRDDATFLQFTGSIDFGGKKSQDVYWGIVAKLREYAGKLNKPEYNVYADLMSRNTSPNPGSVNLMNAMEEILSHEKNPEMANALAVLKKKAEEVVHPEQIGIDVVVMQMVQSYLAGVLFTVNPATKMAGVAQALYQSWYMKDDSLVYRDPKTNHIIGTKPIVVSFDVAFGYGENVVGGKVNPDKFIMGTYDGAHWFVIEKRKGNKLIQMKNVEDVIALLSVKMPEKDQRELAETVREAIAYDEVGKRINGILATKLHGAKYLRPLEGKTEEEKDKKARVQAIANTIADMVKDKDSEAAIIEYIKQNFIVENRKGYPGIQEEALSSVVKEVFAKVTQAQNETERGMKKLGMRLGGMKTADAFISMIKEVWENKEFELSERATVLAKLNITVEEQRNLSYLIRALVDNSFTSNYETTDTHQNTFCMTDEQAQYVARMGWAITEYYKDARDIEFAIEIDRTAPPEKALKLYVIDDKGTVMGMDEKGDLTAVKGEADKARIKGTALRLYNVQARPYTAEYLKVDVIRARTECDEKWLEDHPEVKPIASGTKGENATHGYVLVFDPNKDVAWHADQIRRLKAGHFTGEEIAQLKANGLHDEYVGTGKELPVILYLLEADPNHDPIMRLVDSVVTIRGGDTCHAAIFCREQGIPAVTGAGKVLLRGQLLKTGVAITVDANNGNIYEMDPDPAKRIPVNYVKFKIKPYGIPGDDDGMAYPKVGQIIAAASAAQSNTPIMLAVDAAGNSLTRAEFKGEEIGINVYAGYGHYLLQQIREGKMGRPKQILIQELTTGKVKGSAKFLADLTTAVTRAMAMDPQATADFEKIVGKPFEAADALELLEFYDLKNQIARFGLNGLKLTKKQVDILDTLPRFSENTVDTLEYLYGALQRRFNYDYNIITDLESHPWILAEVDAKLAEKGYADFKAYITDEFTYFYNLMGFTIAPDQAAKNRAYDFAQDKIRGMPGSEVFSWPGVNPLVGLRGTSLEIEAFDEEFGGNQQVLGFLFESVIEAHRNTNNQAWFYVFVRSQRELQSLDKIIGMMARKKGVLPEELGIMIEVPSAAIDSVALARQLSAMGKKYAQYGVKHVFFSFGTNDYSHLAGMGDREDPRMKLELMDPAAIAAVIEMKTAGYYYDEAAKRLPLIDEGADVMLQLIEEIVAAAGDFDVVTGLCGEAITALVNRGDYETAGKIMVLLDSFGVSMMKVRLAASMTRVDTMAATKEITVPEAGRTTLVDMTGDKVIQKKGVIKGKVVFVDTAEDLIPEVLKGLKGAEFQEKKDSLKLQSLESARSTMRTYDSIVVITKNLVAQEKEALLAVLGEQSFAAFVADELLKDIGRGLFVWNNLNISSEKFNEELRTRGFSEGKRTAVMELWQKAWDNTIEGLERRNIDWDDLQYAKAIIVDADVNLEGWDVFNKAKSINPTRIKAVVKGIAAQRRMLESQPIVTLDYGSRRIYKGYLAVRKIQSPPRRLPVPSTKPQVAVEAAVADDANAAYQTLVYHPKLLLAIQKGTVNELGKIFDEYVGKLAEEAEKLTQESNAEKRAWMLERFRKKVEAIPEPVIREFMLEALKGIARDNKLALPGDWMASLRARYFDDLAAGVEKLLAGKTTEQFITGAFEARMRESLKNHPGEFVVHTMTSLTCVDFNGMRGGFLVEQVNPNPHYGLRGAARAVGDMWEVNRMELQAFKEVWESLPVAERKNFGLQVTHVQGTQAGAVMIGLRNVLKEMDIVPGRDGLRVGVDIATPANTLAVDKYFEYFNSLGTGLSFVTYDVMQLGAAWAGVDIYWNQWRRLATEEELRRFGKTAASMVEAKIEAAAMAGMTAKSVVEFRASAPVKAAEAVEAVEAPAVDIQAVTALRDADKKAYDAFSTGFGNFINAVKNVERGAIMLEAKAVLANAGSLTTLKKFKEAGTNLTIIIWSDNQGDLDKVRAAGADTFASLEMRNILNVVVDLNNEGIADSRIALINTGSTINTRYLQSLHKGIKVLTIATPVNNGNGTAQVNTMPLVVAKAAALVSGDASVNDKYAKMAEQYRAKLPEAEFRTLVDLTSEITEMPMITADEELSRAQATYEETMSRI